MRVHIEEEASHVIGLVLFPLPKVFGLQDATGDRDRRVCQRYVLELAPEVRL